MDSVTLFKDLKKLQQLYSSKNETSVFVITGDPIFCTSDIFKSLPSLAIRNCCRSGEKLKKLAQKNY